MTYSPPTFTRDQTDDWKKHLDEEGYVVIRNILSPIDHNNIFYTFMKDWGHVSPGFDIADTKTWNIDNCPLIYGKGMGVFNGFGQSDFMWNLRLNKNIIDLYKEIHSTDELVVSMDGFSVFVSEEQQTKSWLHIDQNPCNPIYSIQGAYNHLPIGENDAGFVVVPKSHKTFTPDVSHKRDWIMHDNQEEIKKESVKLLIPGNCFTLWNSKLIHANKGMTKKKKIKKKEKKEKKDKKDKKEEQKIRQFNRLTAYITYLPKILRSEDVLGKRICAYRTSETTSHWANKCELKRYPFGFGKRYKERGFGNIVARLNKDGDIPADRLELI